jgi:hypothetical protein
MTLRILDTNSKNLGPGVKCPKWITFSGGNLAKKAGGVQIVMKNVINYGGVWINPASLIDNMNPDEQFAWFSNVAMDSNGL